MVQVVDLVGRLSRNLLRILPHKLVCLVGLAFSVGASQAGADTLRVGMYQNAPKIFRDDEGTPSGFWPEFITATFAELEYEPVWIDCAWAQCLELLARGDIDVLPDVAFSEERAARFVFAEHPVLYSWSTILLTGDTRVDELSDLAQLRVSVVENSIQSRSLFQLFEQEESSGSVVEYPSMQNTTDALLDGSVDAAIVNRFFARSALENDVIRAATVPFRLSTLHFAMSPTAPNELAETLDLLVYQQQLDPESAFHQAERRWISQSEPAIPAWLIQMIGAGGVLIGLAAMAIFVLRRTVSLRTAALEETVAKLEMEIEQRERAEEKLRESQRIEALGRLVGGVAHDFNNLLAVILGNLELIERDKLTKDDLVSVDTAQNATERGAELTKQLLSFGRRAALSPKIVDVNDLLSNVDRLIRRVLPATIDVKFVRGAGLCSTALDIAQFEAALLNLAINARDAMPEGGHLTIETANIRLSEEDLDEPTDEMPPGRYVMVAISDTGSGMTKDILSKVFEPFFTTKPVGQGSGMGLAMVYGFVKQSGGAIRVQSEVGTGTSFKLYFPFVEGGAELEEKQPARADVLGSEHILLVEDEPEVRHTLSRQLQQHGYRVSEAADGATALEMVTSEDAYDLVLTDIVMPGDIQGPKLARLLREKYSDLPVIFMSGYPQEAALQGNGLRHDDVQLMKPVHYCELLRALRNKLDQ